MKSTQVFVVLMVACVCVQYCVASPAGVSQAEVAAAGEQPRAAVNTMESGDVSYASARGSTKEGIVLAGARSGRSG
ncbi:hypothetical protein K1T71_014029 [Dendrolimus kikuchii]|uniref:Uncharacterized protein n=1 Tax=Dendrolimus kikuchii TaxID=765133 RepID=A0ACC1CEV0_9NEOP|nr:hypothetical protein K1T71_014029 [Dendrolimus kikuchii]